MRGSDQADMEMITMICLTGDVHHDSLDDNDQKFNPDRSITEVMITCKYVELLEKYDLKATLYVTGKCFTEEAEDLEPVIQSHLVEIGGHTYDGLPLGRLSQIGYRMIGRTPPSHKKSYGSVSAQRKDINKTIDIIKHRTGRDVLSWRSHGLVFDENTYRLLYEAGIRNISDEIRKNVYKPYINDAGLLSHPLNVITDHDHLFHAHRNEEFVAKAKATGYGADEFGSDSYTIKEWGKLVMDQVDNIVENGGVATILMHPMCMYLADDMKTAEEIMKFLAGYKTVWAKEIRSVFLAQGF
ncbi:MAG: polysaccharide deacetylase family protein [Saccharofermentanales bacterium]